MHEGCPHRPHTHTPSGAAPIRCIAIVLMPLRSKQAWATPEGPELPGTSLTVFLAQLRGCGQTGLLKRLFWRFACNQHRQRRKKEQRQRIVEQLLVCVWRCQGWALAFDTAAHTIPCLLATAVPATLPVHHSPQHFCIHSTCGAGTLQLISCYMHTCVLQDKARRLRAAKPQSNQGKTPLYSAGFHVQTMRINQLHHLSGAAAAAAAAAPQTAAAWACA